MTCPGSAVAPCSPSNDPRKQGRCVRCGQVVPSATIDRHAEDERALIREAAEAFHSTAKTAMPAPDQLADFAWARAHDGPVLVEGRDFGREMREEFADAANYAAWWVRYIQSGIPAGDGPTMERTLRALSLVAAAYGELVAEDE